MKANARDHHVQRKPDEYAVTRAIHFADETPVREPTLC